MRMFNADGSEAEMCGNGIRCVAKYVYEHGLCRKPRAADRDRPRRAARWNWKWPAAASARVRVDMGEPILDRRADPHHAAGQPGRAATPRPMRPWPAGSSRVTCVSMGNPHCVTFVDRLSDDWVLGIGPQIEIDPHFPKRVNAEFVEVLSPAEVRDAGLGTGFRRNAGLRHRRVRRLRGRRAHRPHRPQDPRPPARRRPGTALGRRRPRRT